MNQNPSNLLDDKDEFELDDEDEFVSESHETYFCSERDAKRAAARFIHPTWQVEITHSCDMSGQPLWILKASR